MNKVFQNTLILWTRVHGELCRRRPKELFVVGFVVGAVMSSSDRQLAALAKANGVEIWEWLRVCRVALQDGGWQTDGLVADFRNGVLLGCNLLIGPAVIYFVVAFLYRTTLWAGAGALVAFASPRITAYPHFDLIMLPAAAGFAQAIAIRWVVARMRRSGQTRRVVVLQNLDALLGALAGAALIALLLLPALYLAVVGVQFGVEWILAH